MPPVILSYQKHTTPNHMEVQVLADALPPEGTVVKFAEGRKAVVRGGVRLSAMMYSLVCELGDEDGSNIEKARKQFEETQEKVKESREAFMDRVMKAREAKAEREVLPLKEEPEKPKRTMKDVEDLDDYYA